MYQTLIYIDTTNGIRFWSVSSFFYDFIYDFPLEWITNITLINSFWRKHPFDLHTASPGIKTVFDN